MISIQFLSHLKYENMRVLLIFAAFSFISQYCWSEGPSRAPETYFLVEEKTSTRPSLNPIEDLKVLFRKPASQVLLTNWAQIKKALPTPKQKYNRLEQFGSWVVDTRKDDCLNTRAQVLVRDSLSPVEFQTNNPCTVAKGEWQDKSTGEIFEVAKEVHVDHFVPLKNAYIHGGWQWSPLVKCMYANFMGNQFHLVPMSGSENTSKSDQGPEGYMPPNPEHRCEYLRNWLLVKAIWRLALNPAEAMAIQDHLKKENCDLRKFQVSQSYLEKQRKWLSENKALCLGSIQTSGRLEE